MLLAAGAPGKRFALPNARVLIHQPHGGAQGQTTDIELAAKEFGFLRDRMAQVLADHTGQTRERILRDIDRDYILRGDDAIAYGLIDGVLAKRRLADPLAAAAAMPADEPRPTELIARLRLSGERRGRVVGVDSRPPSVDAIARSLVDVGLPHPLLVDAARRAIAPGTPSAPGPRPRRCATRSCGR